MAGQRFILGVDLDGVCGDYVAALRPYAAAARGVDPASLTDDVTWDFSSWGLDRAGFLDLHRQAVDGGMFATMPQVDGASDTLWRLSNDDVWIRIITHRLIMNRTHHAVTTDTVLWLEENNIPYRDLCFIGEKAQVGAHCYIDDAPHNIEALRDAGNTVIIFDQPYNRNLPGLRAHGWADAERIVRDLAGI